jgi:hypothetical protein
MNAFILAIAILTASHVIVYPDKPEYPTIEACQQEQLTLIDKNRDLYYEGRLILVCQPK